MNNRHQSQEEGLDFEAFSELENIIPEDFFQLFQDQDASTSLGISNTELLDVTPGQLTALDTQSPAHNTRSTKKRRKAEEELETDSIERPKKKKKSDPNKIREYKNRYVFLGDINKLPMTGKELKARLVPKDAKIEEVISEGEKNRYFVDGEEVVTINRMYYLRDAQQKAQPQSKPQSKPNLKPTRQYDKYFFKNGEPVPTEKLTAEAIKLKKVEGQPIISDEGFYRRDFIFVDTNKALTKSEKRQMEYNRLDGKLYFDKREVIWNCAVAPALAPMLELPPIQRHEIELMENVNNNSEVPDNLTQLAEVDSSNKKIVSARENKHRYIYIDDLSAETLSRLTFKEKIQRLVPEDVIVENGARGGRGSNQRKYANGRRVIKYGALSEHIYCNADSKFFYDNGEPVPTERLTPTIKKARKLNGRKIFNDAYFYNRNYKFVDTQTSLTRSEKKEMEFKFADEKLYLNNREVYLDSSTAVSNLEVNTETERDVVFISSNNNNNQSFDTLIASSPMELEIVATPAADDHIISFSEAELEVLTATQHAAQEIVSSSSDMDYIEPASVLEEELQVIPVIPEMISPASPPGAGIASSPAALQIPEVASEIICAQSTTLSLAGITLTINSPVTVDMLEPIQMHLREIQRICQQGSIYSAGHTPTLFPSAAQRANLQMLNNSNQCADNQSIEYINQRR